MGAFSRTHTDTHKERPLIYIFFILTIIHSALPLSEPPSQPYSNFFFQLLILLRECINNIVYSIDIKTLCATLKKKE